MAGSLIKIDEEIVTSAVASVTLGGADWDSSYDVYMVRYKRLETDSSSANTIAVRFLASSSPDTSSNYDYAYKTLKDYASFSNDSNTNLDRFYLSTIYTANFSQDSGIIYLFNFNNSSEYSFCTIESTARNSRPGLGGSQGGAVLTVAQATNGIQFFMNATGNIDNGHFVLYGLKK